MLLGAVLLIVALTVLAIPVAGAAGTALHDDLARQFAAQRSERTTCTRSAARGRPGTTCRRRLRG